VDVRFERHYGVVPANRHETPLTGHTVAGLIDAEASFLISEMNGGRTLSCGMHLAVRDDDVDLLHSLAGRTGVGVVRQTSQRGNPQALWDVCRKDEASELARLLDAHPLRSRKRQDFEVWRDAVALWSRGGADRFARMRELQAELRSVRAYRAPRAVSAATHLNPTGFDDWLAGFVAGDGSFGIRLGAVRLTVRLRADDAPLLHAIMAATRAGKVSGPHANPGSNPVMSWNVCSKSDLVGLVRRLEGRVPGRKAAEFAVWRRAVEANADKSLARQAQRQLVDEAERELKQLRRYRPPRTPLPSADIRRGNRMFEQNRRWLALLRAWAAAEPGALTAVAYQHARRDGWPTRNTLAERFGSWYDALAAARLSDRAVLLPELRDRRLAGGERAREERRRIQRERVLAAMRRCAAELGRLPGPTEYARWRLHNEPRAPSFVTAYRLFPGGWSEIRAALA
jgi:LAGLIDADG endonuclease